MRTSGRGSSARSADGDDHRSQGSVLAETAELWRFAAQHGFADELKRLHRPRPSRFLFAALFDWSLIAAATVAVCVYGWGAVLISAVVVGNRQRALGNLLHDASHWSMDRDRPKAKWLSNLLFCWPLTVSMPLYRLEHNQHHRYLGDDERDPDFIQDERRLSKGWVSVWLDQLRSPRMLRASILGNLDRMSGRARLGCATWWAVTLALVTAGSGAAHALTFLLLWIVSKATAFHAITSFREISDHVGLSRGSLIGFSRNHPFESITGVLVHPHKNGYHLLHHLVPGIPFYALPGAHALVSRWPRYARAEQCTSYFTGERSAVRSWVSRFRPRQAV